jgi:zinc protease
VRIGILAAILAVALGGSFASAAPVPTHLAPTHLAPTHPSHADPADQRLTPDPAIRQGTLPNGLRYVLKSHSSPKNSVSIRLRFDVGSILEEDDELGVAHYVEHMAFSGGRALPPGQVEALFSERGVQFGRDQNATTSAYETIYQLDLPQADPVTLDLGFGWMRDVADGLIIAPDAVDRERGIIVHEREAMRSGEQIQNERIRAFLWPDLRVTQRNPIGTPESLAAMKASTVRRFYERWYRPENALIVVVADVPIDELERRVKAGMSTWTGKGPAPKRPAPVAFNANRGFEARAWNSARATGDNVELCLVKPAVPLGVDTYGTNRRDAIRETWQNILNDRLAEISRRPESAFHSALVEFQDDHHEAAETCIGVNPADDWQSGLAAARAEIRRFQTHGPTEQEVKRALAGRMAAMRFGRDHADGYPNPTMATFIMQEVARGDTVVSFDERYRIEAGYATITAADVAERFRQDWTGAGPLVTVTTSRPPSVPEIGAAWAKIQTNPDPGPYQPPVEHAWAYGEIGPRGAVVSRVEMKDPDFVRLTLSNGVIVNFKSAPFAKNEVIVRVAMGRGREELRGVSYQAASIGADTLVLGGLGRNSTEDLKRLFPQSFWSFEMQIEPRVFEITGRTSAPDLDVQLQILSAFLTDPGFRPGMDPDIRAGVATLYRTYFTQPHYAASDAMFQTVAPTSGLNLPPFSALQDLQSTVVDKALRPILTRDPIEVTIVGDISEQTTVDALLHTVGAMAPRAPYTPPPGQPSARFTRYGPAPDKPIRTTFRAADKQGSVVVVWPLFVTSPARRHEERVLRITTSVLQDALRHRLREQMGETYAPAAVITIDDFADQGSISVYVECTPDRAEAVLAAVRAVAADFAAGRIDPAQLEAVRKPMLLGGADRKQTIDWWLYTLSGSAQDPDLIAIARTWEPEYSAITIEEVRAVSKTWLGKPGIAVIATPEETGGK